MSFVGTTDYKRAYIEKSDEFTQNSKNNMNHTIDKENERRNNYDNSKIQENTTENKQSEYYTEGQKYFSGKDYDGKTLEFDGNHKMKTSIKNKPERELENFDTNKKE